MIWLPFAYGPTGHNWHFGHVRNPWNTAHITGGSSSGPGAAAAARATSAALGAATGAATRLPAALRGMGVGEGARHRPRGVPRDGAPAITPTTSG